jgi:3-deoxy-D-manno-octulosonate 8-phosphate phosphatase (KDO 8-P phosphatase)
MVTIVISDIDGVLTDGCVWMSEDGRETKSIFYRDLDAIGELQRHGVVVAFLTGEVGAWVEQLRRRLPCKYFYPGCKDKLAAVEEILALEHKGKHELCFVGDGISDICSLKFAGISACPSDSHPDVLSSVQIVLPVAGGRGVLSELVRKLYPQ